MYLESENSKMSKKMIYLLPLKLLINHQKLLIHDLELKYLRLEEKWGLTTLFLKFWRFYLLTYLIICFSTMRCKMSGEFYQNLRKMISIIYEDQKTQDTED